MKLDIVLSKDVLKRIYTDESIDSLADFRRHREAPISEDDAEIELAVAMWREYRGKIKAEAQKVYDFDLEEYCPTLWTDLPWKVRRAWVVVARAHGSLLSLAEAVSVSAQDIADREVTCYPAAGEVER